MTDLQVAEPRGLLLLKLARPRTWCFIVTMFVFGYASSGDIDPLVLTLGIVIFSVMTAVSNLFNAWTGQVEDRINLPHRQVWLDRIGASWTKATIVACYLVLFTLPWLVSPIFAFIVGLGALMSVIYSWGPNLKAHPILSLVAFSTGVLVPFIAGWMINRDFASLNPIVWVIAYFFFAYGTLKNLPDVEGDRAAGVTTVFTMFDRDTAAKVCFALLLSPYVALVAMMLAGVLDARFVLALVFSPVVPLLITKTLRARSQEEKESTHALGYFYQLFFFLMILLLYSANTVTILATAVVAAVAILADWLKIDSRPYDLHWGAMFRLGDGSSH
jgi:4-hydroxybenzoate polyprenyltransferase